MIKPIIVTLAILLTSTCVAANDIEFYSLHPVELQGALEQCPESHPDGVSCEQLDECAVRANKLVDELHYNPQYFGQKILALQERMVELETDFKNNAHNPKLQASFEENRKQLNERLAIVKWLESPRG